MLRFRLPETLFHGTDTVDNDPSIVTTGPVAAEAVEEPAVAQFLDDVVQRLAPLTDDARAGIRQELRVHLEALIAAHEELGGDHEAAAVAAIRQFGEPQAIARRFRRAWAATSGDTPRAAMRKALFVFGMATIICIGVYTFGHMVIGQPIDCRIWPYPDDYGRGAKEFIWMGCQSIGLYIVPLFAGARVGRQFPRSGVIGVGCAISLLLLASALFSYADINTLLHQSQADHLSFVSPHPREVVRLWAFALILPIGTTMTLSVWLLLGCVAAGASSVLKLTTKNPLRRLPFARG